MVQYSWGLNARISPFALDDEAERDGLDPAGGKTGLDAAPEQRADLVAHQPVEDAAGLLGVDLLLVDIARRLHGLLDRVLGDLVKEDPVGWHRHVELVGHVPGDGLAFTVRVGGQVDRGGPLGRLLELGKGFRLSFNCDVLGREAVFHVHPQLAGGQVAKVAHGGAYVVAAPQVLPDGPGLGGRLDDDQRAPRRPGHGRPGRFGLCRFSLGGLGALGGFGGLFGSCHGS